MMSSAAAPDKIVVPENTVDWKRIMNLLFPSLKAVYVLGENDVFRHRDERDVGIAVISPDVIVESNKFSGNIVFLFVYPEIRCDCGSIPKILNNMFHDAEVWVFGRAAFWKGNTISNAFIREMGNIRWGWRTEQT